MQLENYRDLSRIDHISKQKRPSNSFLGFDLTAEQNHINKEHKAYYTEFINNAEFYAKETYGKPPAVRYMHEVIQTENGEMRLKMENRDVLARESYIRGMYNENHPDWLRARAIKDYEWMVSLEEQLQQAKPGDIFIDASPTAFDISIKERQKYMFGNHSFLRLHQFVEENGKKILKSVAILHYLDPEKQKDLYNWLTEQSLQAESLLGNVSKLENSLGISDVSDVEQVRKLVGLVNNIYIHTPVNERLPQDIQIDETVLNSHLNTLRPWLQSIFYMMKNHDNPRTIEKSFHGWENAFKARISGNYNPDDDIHFEALRIYMRDEIYSASEKSVDSRASYQEMFAMMHHYMSQEYKPSANMCGNGAGYSDYGNGSQPIWSSGKMDYISLTENYLQFLNKDVLEKLNITNDRHEDYRCPDCQWLIKGEIKGSHPSTWTPKCPNCPHVFDCARVS